MKGITEAEFAQAVDSRSDKPIYSIMRSSRIGIAGLGGLGSNIAAALARSGVGHLILADFDTVELSNINRQLYTLNHIGQKKAEALPMILTAIVGLVGIGGGFIGYLNGPMSMPLRLISFAGGICMVIPGTLTDLIGAAVIVAVFAVNWMLGKKRASAN